MPQSQPDIESEGLDVRSDGDPLSRLAVLEKLVRREIDTEVLARLQHPHWSYARIGQILGISRSAVYERYKQMLRLGGLPRELLPSGAEVLESVSNQLAELRERLAVVNDVSELHNAAQLQALGEDILGLHSIWLAQRRAAIVRLKARGMSQYEIANLFNLSKTRVAQLLGEGMGMVDP